MPYFQTINRSHAHNTHDKNKDDTEQQNNKTLTHTRHTHAHATTSDNGLEAVVRVVVDVAHKIVVGGLTRAAPPRAATWWG